MPSVLMDAQRRRIESLLAAGLSPKAIATEEEVHLATVYRYRKNLLAHGSALITFHQKLGRPRSLNALHLMALETLLLNQPHLYLDEIQYWLWDNFD